MAPRRRRVVHLITRLELGGAQQNTLYCVKHHDRERYAVSLWAGAGGILDAEAARIEDADVRLLPWLVHPIDPLKDAVAVMRLAGMLDGVDLLHTHSSKAGILGRVAAALAGVPAVVHTVHGWSFNDVQPRPARRAGIECERAAARLSSRLICVARRDMERGIALGIGRADQYVVIRSGIDPGLYAPRDGVRARVRRALGAGPETVVVGAIANLKPQKGPLDFVEAARLASREDPRLRFVFAGDGELRGDVERAIDRAGLRGIVHLLGWRADVAELLAGMDIFLLTSVFEGLPRTVLQAMAASVPVVATDTGGVTEVLIDGETGLLVPRSDPPAAAAAICALAASETRRAALAAAARSRLAGEFDIGRMLADLEALYNRLLPENSVNWHPATLTSHLGVDRRTH